MVATARPIRRRLAPRTASWVTAAAFTLVMAVGTAPAPLWPLYQSDVGLATTTITVVAGAVVPGAVVSFLLLGHLSDRYGRRRVLVPFLYGSVAALVVMAVWPTGLGLVVGRVVTGLALGVTAPTATAYLIDLGGQDHRGRRRAATLATAANLGGLAVGPVVAGAMAEYLPAPLVLPYVALAVLLGITAVGVAACPETVQRRAPVRRSRFALRPGAASAFCGAASAGFVAFAVTGLFGVLGGIVVRQDLGVDSVLVWGLTTGLVFAASAVAQLATGRWPAARSHATGAAALPVGMGLVVLSVTDPQPVVYAVACTVTGAACGLLFKAGLLGSADAAEPASRAGVLAVHFTVAYLGMGLGAVVLAALQLVVGTPEAFALLGAVMTGVAAGGAVLVRRRRPSS